jgi:hypothetical protein
LFGTERRRCACNSSSLSGCCVVNRWYDSVGLYTPMVSLHFKPSHKNHGHSHQPVRLVLRVVHHCKVDIQHPYELWMRMNYLRDALTRESLLAEAALDVAQHARVVRVALVK